VSENTPSPFGESPTPAPVAAPAKPLVDQLPPALIANLNLIVGGIAVLMVLFLFFPAVSFRGFGSSNFFDGGAVVWGPMLILGLVTATLAVLVYLKKFPELTFTAALFGAVTGLSGMFVGFGAGAGTTGSLGIGAWLMGFFGLILLAASALWAFVQLQDKKAVA